MKKLSVIVCCYNENATIETVLEKTWATYLGDGWEREVIVVDNYSTDGTRDYLRGIDHPETTVIFHDRNRGKGASVRTAIEAMSGDYMLIQDADSEYDPAEHVNFCRQVDQTDAAAIFGSRVLGGKVNYEYVHAYIGVRFLTSLVNLLFGGDLTDVATATKMVKVDLVKRLNLVGNGFDLDFELANKILLSGNKIIEIPIKYDPRTYAEGKKIKSSDGFRAILVMLRDRLGLSAVWKETGNKAPVKPGSVEETA